MQYKNLTLLEPSAHELPCRQSVIEGFDHLDAPNSLRYQLYWWVMGVSVHCDKYPTCVPDFSCCLRPEEKMPFAVRRRYLETFLSDDISGYFSIKAMGLDMLGRHKELEASVCLSEVADDLIRHTREQAGEVH